jgi:hypothetical protein
MTDFERQTRVALFNLLETFTAQRPQACPVYVLPTKLANRHSCLGLPTEYFLGRQVKHTQLHVDPLQRLGDAVPSNLELE